MTHSHPIRISIVVPLFNEVENVAPLLERIHEVMSRFSGPWELICVDDGSTDGTPEKLVQEAARYSGQVVVVPLSRNFGQTAAMQAGFDRATGDLIVTLDGDLQNDPADIPAMVNALLERDLDLIQGWRYNRQDDWLRSALSRTANRLIGKVTGLKLHDYGCSLKVYRGEVIRKVRLYGEMHRFIPVWLASHTAPHRIGEMRVTHHPRVAGTSKYTLSRTFRVVLDLLTAFFFLRYRARPGHFFGSIGLVIGTLGTLILSYLAVIKFGFGEDIGQRPLFMIGIFMVLSAIQFITTGVLAELLSRTFFQSKSEPAYEVRESPHRTPEMSGDTLWKAPVTSPPPPH